MECLGHLECPGDQAIRSGSVIVILDEKQAHTIVIGHGNSSRTWPPSLFAGLVRRDELIDGAIGDAAGGILNEKDITPYLVVQGPVYGTQQFVAAHLGLGSGVRTPSGIGPPGRSPDYAPPH